MKQYMSMEAMLPRCSAEHRELSTIRPNLIRTQSNRPELGLSIQQLYLQWSPSLKPERSSYRGASLAFNGRQLTSYNDGTNAISYIYDASGLRASKTVNGETTVYQYVAC